MEILFKVGNKSISDIDTTILHTSKYNYSQDIVKLVHEQCEVISRNYLCNVNDIPLRLLDEFNLLELINKDKLTREDEILISVLNSLISNKNIIVFFDVLTFISSEIKEKVIRKLQEQKKRIINYSSDIEETLLLDYIILVHQNNVIMEGLTKDILLEEKIIKKLGFNLPCVVELSNGLRYYNLVKKVYFDKIKFVEDLWK